MVSDQEISTLSVHSALFKQRTCELVVMWAATSEYPLLYVFDPFFVVIFFIFMGKSYRGGPFHYSAVSLTPIPA